MTQPTRQELAAQLTQIADNIIAGSAWGAVFTPARVRSLVNSLAYLVAHTPPVVPTVDEHAIRSFDDWQILADDSAEAVTRLQSHRKVYRRQIVVVQDWTEVNP